MTLLKTVALAVTLFLVAGVAYSSIANQPEGATVPICCCGIDCDCETCKCACSGPDCKCEDCCCNGGKNCDCCYAKGECEAKGCCEAKGDSEAKGGCDASCDCEACDCDGKGGPCECEKCDCD